MDDKSTNTTSLKLLAMCEALWNEHRCEVFDYETLDMERYTRRFSVIKFPKNLIAPILLKRTEPTLEDAEELRAEINRWHTSKRNPTKEELKAAQMEIQTAIAVLKKKGYRVMKKTTAFIDV